MKKAIHDLNLSNNEKNMPTAIFIIKKLPAVDIVSFIIYVCINGLPDF